MPFVKPPGTDGARMDPPAADQLDHAVAAAARLDHLAADLEAHLADHAEQVALGDRRVRAEDDVRPAEHVEVRGVVGHVEGAEHELAQQACRPRRLDAVDRVGGLGRGQVVCLGAHAADAIGQDGHLLDRPADAEGLEAAQLGHLEVRSLHVARVIEEDLDLAVAFEAGDRVDGQARHRATSSARGGSRDRIS